MSNLCIKVLIFYCFPPTMSSRPARKIVPTAKLTAENAGDLELTSHRSAIAATLAAPQPQRTPFVPSSPVSEPLQPTLATDTSPASSPDQVPVRTSTSTKRPRPRPLLPANSIQTIPDDNIDSDGADDAPKVKKAKATPHQVGSMLQTEASIIEINDGDDQQNERLNKIDPSADIKAFFTAVPHVPGQNKGRMKCNLCA
jgi:hypothetical protein